MIGRKEGRVYMHHRNEATLLLIGKAQEGFFIGGGRKESFLQY